MEYESFVANGVLSEEHIRHLFLVIEIECAVDVSPIVLVFETTVNDCEVSDLDAPSTAKEFQKRLSRDARQRIDLVIRSAEMRQFQFVFVFGHE